jgi:hypothetical protein
MYYGTRYLPIDRFITYCKSLNVSTDKKELEYYENQGLMFPTARVIKPKEYIQEAYDWSSGLKGEIDRSKWPELALLDDRPNTHDYSDGELIDSFDRSLDDKNPFISVPTESNFKPWDSYNFVVKNSEGIETTRSMAEHFYSYWQVHQLYKIQSFPDLYENVPLLNLIPDELKKQHYLPRALNKEIYRDFENKAHLFDALSFFIVVYNREKERTFANATIEDGIQQLTAPQFEQWVKNIKKHSQFVTTRFNLSEKDILDFIVFLLEKKNKYEDNEKIKLSREIVQDIHYCTMLIDGLANKDIVKIAEELGKTSFWIAESLLNVNLNLRYANRAKVALKACYEQYKGEFTSKGFKEEDINEIVKYCLNNDLIILLYSLDQSVFIGDEIYLEDTNTRREISIRNLSTSFEYFLGIISGNFGQDTLKGLIQNVFSGEVWLQEFMDTTSPQKGWNVHTDFASYDTNYKRAMAKTNLDLRNIILAYIARNLFVHSFPPDMWVFRDIYGEFFSAVKYSIINAWIVGKDKSLI